MPAMSEKNALIKAVPSLFFSLFKKAQYIKKAKISAGSGLCAKL